MQHRRRWLILAAAGLAGRSAGHHDRVHDPGEQRRQRPLQLRQLQHSPWNGWTLTDLVFPSFLFIAGISIVFSSESRLARGESKNTMRLHVLRRAVILFCLGLVVNGFPLFPLGTLRIYGVLQRIAVCFLLASLLYLWNSRAWVTAATAVTALLGYWILMRWVPIPGIGLPTHDVPLLDQNQNWVAFVDRKILPRRLYERVRDPEGLLSDIPAMGTILFGVLTGIWLRRPKALTAKAMGLLVGAVSGSLLGELWNIWFPINKKLWTSSYVLFAAGCTFLLLAVCFYAVEIKGWTRRWTFPWLVFGSNAITAYVLSELLAGGLYTMTVHEGGKAMDLQQYIFQKWFFPGDESFVRIVAVRHCVRARLLHTGLIDVPEENVRQDLGSYTSLRTCSEKEEDATCGRIDNGGSDVALGTGIPSRNREEASGRRKIEISELHLLNTNAFLLICRPGIRVDAVFPRRGWKECRTGLIPLDQS